MIAGIHFAEAGEAVREAFGFFSSPRRLAVWEWAEANRWLRKSITAKPGPYRLFNGPYQKEPQESFHDPEVQITVLQWGRRLGKTEMLNNLHGSTIDLRPANILVAYPILESAKKWSKQFFIPMIRSTPSLRKLVSLRRSRETNNTILTKEYPGGFISAIGSNSMSSFRQIQAPIVTLDEIDDMKNG